MVVGQLEFVGPPRRADSERTWRSKFAKPLLLHTPTTLFGVTPSRKARIGVGGVNKSYNSPCGRIKVHTSSEPRRSTTEIKLGLAELTARRWGTDGIALEGGHNSNTAVGTVGQRSFVHTLDLLCLDSVWGRVYFLQQHCCQTYYWRRFDIRVWSVGAVSHRRRAKHFSIPTPMLFMSVQDRCRRGTIPSITVTVGT